MLNSYGIRKVGRSNLGVRVRLGNGDRSGHCPGPLGYAFTPTSGIGCILPTTVSGLWAALTLHKRPLPAVSSPQNIRHQLSKTLPPTSPPPAPPSPHSHLGVLGVAAYKIHHGRIKNAFDSQPSHHPCAQRRQKITNAKHPSSQDCVCEDELVPPPPIPPASPFIFSAVGRGQRGCDVWACTDHVTDHAPITWLIMH